MRSKYTLFYVLIASALLMNISNAYSVIDNIDIPPVPTQGIANGPEFSVFHNNKIYVLSPVLSKVSILNTNTNLVNKIIDITSEGSNPSFGTVVNNKLYVLNSDSDNVSIIDTSTDTIINSINVGDSPEYAIATGTKLYVINRSSNNVSIIDTTTDTVSKTLSVGNSPSKAYYLNNKIYVLNNNANTVSAIDITTDTVTQTISTGSTGMFEGTVYENKLYVLNSASSSVSVVNTLTDTIIDTISVISSPIGLKLASNGKIYVYKGSSGTNTTIIDPSNDTVVGTVSFGPQPILIESIADKMYVFHIEGVSVYDLDDNSLIQYVPISIKSNSPVPRSTHIIGDKIYASDTLNSVIYIFDTSNNSVIYFTPDTSTLTSYPFYGTIVGDTLYVNSSDDNKVVPVNLTTNTALTAINVGNSPTLSVATSTKLYVINSDSDNVYLIDTTNNLYVKTITVGSYPYDATIIGNKLYVINSGSATNNVSIIDITSDTVTQSITAGSYPFDSYSWGNTLYVVDSDNVYAIDTETDMVIATISSPGSNSMVEGNGKLYVFNYSNDNVSVIDLNTNTLITTITVGDNPSYGVYINNKIYVTNESSNNISVIDTLTDTLITNIDVGIGPSPIEKRGSIVYVGNRGTTTVSLIDSGSDTVVSTLDVGITPSDLVAGDDYVYVMNYGSAFVSVLSTNDLSLPVISNINSNAISQNSANISFVTDKFTTSTISYGPLNNYTNTNVSTILTKNHSISLSNLQPATTYYYQITVTDENSNSFTGILKTFTTLSTIERPAISNPIMSTPGSSTGLTPIIGIGNNFSSTTSKINEKDCFRFSKNMKFGMKNQEVLYIKKFLNRFMGESFDTTFNFYGRDTFAAIKRFQNKYNDEILKPLGLKNATGFWYSSTIKQANSMFDCKI